MISPETRKLGDDDTPQDSLAADPDDDEADSDTTFATLANRLIADANNSGRSDFDNAVTDDRRVPSITSPSQPRAATASAKTRIPLAKLFDYDLPDNGLDFYWKEGLKNLEEESSACKALHMEREGIVQAQGDSNYPPLSANSASTSAISLSSTP